MDEPTSDDPRLSSFTEDLSEKYNSDDLMNELCGVLPDPKKVEYYTAFCIVGNGAIDFKRTVHTFYHCHKLYIREHNIGIMENGSIACETMTFVFNEYDETHTTTVKQKKWPKLKDVTKLSDSKRINKLKERIEEKKKDPANHLGISFE